MAILLTLFSAQVLAGPLAPPSSPPAATEAHSTGIAGPPVPATPKPARARASACKTPMPSEPGVIVVCAERQEGYRLNPDVIAARKEVRNPGGPRKRETLRDTSCATVGPAPCMGQQGVNLLAAALVAANVLRTAMTGGDVGKLFVTDPQMSEYELYQAARRDREQAEAEAPDDEDTVAPEK